MEYKIEVNYTGKGFVIANGKDEAEAVKTFAKGDFRWLESQIEDVERVAEPLPLQQKYMVKWVEEKEAWFYATSEGTAEWKASCADDRELTSKNFKVIKIEKID